MRVTCELHNVWLTCVSDVSHHAVYGQLSYAMVHQLIVYLIIL